MKAVQIVKPNQLEVIDIEKPVIDPKNNVLVKMTAAGICGSDVGIYHGTNAQLLIRVLSDTKWLVSLQRLEIMFLL